jgi:hypothetical protein
MYWGRLRTHLAYSCASPRRRRPTSPPLTNQEVGSSFTNGSLLGEKVFNATKAGTISTVNYNFPKPGTTDPVAKESYVTQVGNQGCGVGYYK